MCLFETNQYKMNDRTLLSVPVCNLVYLPGSIYSFTPFIKTALNLSTKMMKVTIRSWCAGEALTLTWWMPGFKILALHSSFNDWSVTDTTVMYSIVSFSILNWTHWSLLDMVIFLDLTQYKSLVPWNTYLLIYGHVYFLL